MPAASRSAAKRFELVREVLLSRARVWEILSHTDHLNRAIGLPAVAYGAPDENLVREAHAKFHGLEMRWREFPFEWIAGREYSIRREYLQGPLQSFEGGVELQDAGADATRVRLWADIAPANFLGAALLPFLARSSLQKTWSYCRAALENQAASTPLPLPIISAPPDAIRLQRLVTKLGDDSRRPELAKRLGEFLQTRGDDEVARIKPFQLAAQWREDRDEVLRLCLHATRAGLLNLSWNLMCPNCRVSKSEVSSLGQVEETAHCDLCGVHFDVNFDRYVELRFAPHPSIRVAHESVFCLSGPFLTPHVVAQKRLGAGASTALAVPDSSDELRVRVVGANHVLELVEEPAAEEPAAGENARAENSAPPAREIYQDGWARGRVLRPRGAALEIENRASREIAFVLEKVAWDDEAVTAARVTAMPEFRAHFSSEVLAPGRHIAIENLTLLFSDLRDSTQLYEREGDAPAYGCVRKHFDFLSTQIESNGGAIVKTIGDAVMAVFQNPHDALRAALEIQKRLKNFNANLPQNQNLVIKIGLHHGPAIAVNSNQKLDYFGRVVNIAARLGGVSEGDDVVLSESIFQDESAQDVLREYSASVESASALLKGIEGEVAVFRARLPNQPRVSSTSLSVP